MALEVVDRAMQSFGAEGVSQDTELAYHWAQLRTLRIADVSVEIVQHETRSMQLPTFRDPMLYIFNKSDNMSSSERLLW